MRARDVPINMVQACLSGILGLWVGRYRPKTETPTFAVTHVNRWMTPHEVSRIGYMLGRHIAYSTYPWSSSVIPYPAAFFLFYSPYSILNSLTITQ